MRHSRWIRCHESHFMVMSSTSSYQGGTSEIKLDNNLISASVTMGFSREEYSKAIFKWP